MFVDRGSVLPAPALLASEVFVPQYDALLIVSFGGPEGPDEVLPFLENVLRGKRVPRERMLEVAEHYQHFGGKSPINDQCRQLIAALEAEFAAHDFRLPIYWGNRNWHPLLTDTIRLMAEAGVKRAICFMTSAFSSYSGCRQYREDLARAIGEVGPSSPEFDKLRVFFNHPGFIGPMIEKTQAACDQIPAERRPRAALVFTAHSIPLAMAAGCRYEAQLQEACRLVAEGVGQADWRLVYQSRSGSPTQPWLEPDIGDYLRELRAAGCEDAVVVPIGFISDHMEVLFDLDTEAADLAREIGLNMIRAGTVGTHPDFIRMIRELILERMDDSIVPQALGEFGPNHHICPANCCLPGGDRPSVPAVCQRE